MQVTSKHTYNGTEQTPTLEVTLGEFGSLTLDTDYTISYTSNRTNAGTVNFTVNFKGNFQGSKEGSFKIDPKSIEDFEVSGVASTYEYTGSPIDVKPVVPSVCTVPTNVAPLSTTSFPLTMRLA